MRISGLAKLREAITDDQIRSALIQCLKENTPMWKIEARAMDAMIPRSNLNRFLKDVNSGIVIQPEIDND